MAKPGGRLLLVDFRFGQLREWKDLTLRALSSVIECFSGHYSGYLSFKATVGVPQVVDRVGLTIESEKIVAGGNVAVYVTTPKS